MREEKNVLTFQRICEELVQFFDGDRTKAGEAIGCSYACMSQYLTKKRDTPNAERFGTIANNVSTILQYPKEAVELTLIIASSKSDLGAALLTTDLIKVLESTGSSSETQVFLRGKGQNNNLDSYITSLEPSLREKVERVNNYANKHTEG